MICWNPQRVSISNIILDSQWITCDVESKQRGDYARVTFVYGHNSPTERIALWSYLSHQQTVNGPCPWMVTGDFNAIMHPSDRNGGDNSWANYMDDFPNCIAKAELMQIKGSGMRFTWHNGRQGDASILKKLDWAFGNHHLLAKWPLAQATFQARVASDHSPMVINLGPRPPRQGARFKFLNHWTKHEGFDRAVQLAWGVRVQGNPINRLTAKLRLLKGYLNNLHKAHRMACIVYVMKMARRLPALRIWAY
ncbi:hypothetical protein OIU85_023212 [Salix viminalis]|uniref:Endonuclease/exonuclease/phosphatase domain-containing protein n=1 Tax=Salix viminalis TaxID=40686 RepID=A0A9Q0NI11_SALVM|nr:hypothetical protein OIU85_023212 [Salix viminalis]